MMTANDGCDGVPVLALFSLSSVMLLSVDGVSKNFEYMSLLWLQLILF